MQRWSKAIDTFDEIDKRFKREADPAIRELVAEALFNKGVEFGEHGRWKEAIESYDAVDRRFRGETEPAIRELVAEALFNKGVALDERDSLKSGVAPNGIREAIEVYDAVEKRFGEETQLAMRELVASALFNKGVAHILCADRKNLDEAIKAFDAVERRSRGEADPAIRELVSAALWTKSIIPGEINAEEDSISVIERKFEGIFEAIQEVLKRFRGENRIGTGQAGRHGTLRKNRRTS